MIHWTLASLAADLQFSFGEGDVLDAGDEGQRLAVGEVLGLLAQAAPLSSILQLILGNMHINHESQKVVFYSKESRFPQF